MKKNFLKLLLVFLSLFVITSGFVATVSADYYDDSLIVNTDLIHKELIDLYAYEPFTRPTNIKFTYDKTNFNRYDRTITFDKIEITFNISSSVPIPIYEIGMFIGENYSTFPNFLSFTCYGEPSFYNYNNWLFYGVRRDVTIKLSEEEWYKYTNDRRNELYDFTSTGLNCYGYVMDYPNSLDPGFFSGYPIHHRLNENFFERVQDDLSIFYAGYRIVDANYTPQEYEKVIAAILYYNQGDYHFLQKYSDGIWRHTFPGTMFIYQLKGNPDYYKDDWVTDKYYPDSNLWTRSDSKKINVIKYYVVRLY